MNCCMLQFFCHSYLVPAVNTFAVFIGLQLLIHETMKWYADYGWVWMNFATCNVVT